MIFLQILKIIGIILLILIGIIALLLLLILFFPISYRIQGYYKKEYKVSGTVSWLFHALCYHFIIDNEKMLQYIRILGLRKNISGDSKKEKTGRISKKKDVTEKNAYTEEDFFDDDIENEDDIGNDEHTANNDINNGDILIEETIKEENTSKSEKAYKAKKLIPSIKEVFKKIKNTIIEIWKKLCSFFRQAKYWNTVVYNPIYKEAIAFLKDQIFSLLKAITPSKMKLDASFSIGSPDYTGLALGVLSMFPIAYQNRWKIYPDFESEDFYIDAEFDVRGHFFSIQVIIIIFKIIFNKNCRQLYHEIRK